MNRSLHVLCDANRSLALLLAAGLGLSLAGCNAGPNYKRPVVNLPSSYRGAMAPEIASSVGTANKPDAAKPTAAAADNADPKPATTWLGAQSWQTVFTDPVLQQLIRRALQNNYDVKIAADRVLEEQARLGMTKSAEYPSVDAGASYVALGLPGGLLGNSKSSQSTYFFGGLTGSVAWNLDFWGYYRRQTEAQRAYLRATEWAQQTTYSTLIEDVATDYDQLRSLDAQLDLTRKTFRARQQSLALTQTLERGGAESLADVRQAEELCYAAQAQIPALQSQIASQENDLRLLLGEAPGPIDRGYPVADAPHPVGVPVGLPTDLLERRPDVRRAEELLVQANANIGVARAAYFPQLSITAEGGLGSSQFDELLNPANGYYYAVGGLTQPIFNAGKIRDNYHLALSAHKELLDTYQQTIAEALRDVSNALVAYHRSREYRDLEEKQVAAAADALRLARIRYQGGATSYLEVLTTDTNLYNAELTLNAVERQEALALVQLYNALGGGW